MNNKKILSIGAAIIILVGAGFFLWQNREPEVTMLANSQGIVLPLVIKGDLPVLTPEQEKEIANFRALILKRVKANTPLTREEKITLAISITTTKKEAPPGTVLIDQNIYQFNADELRAISEALNR